MSAPTVPACSHPNGHRMAEAGKGVDETGTHIVWLMCDHCGRLDRRQPPPVDDGQLELFSTDGPT